MTHERNVFLFAILDCNFLPLCLLDVIPLDLADVTLLVQLAEKFNVNIVGSRHFCAWIAS